MHSDCPISSSLKLQPVERESAIDPLEAGFLFAEIRFSGRLAGIPCHADSRKGQKTELGPFSSFR